jgi:branched-chain amino acid aminotransferase
LTPPFSGSLASVDGQVMLASSATIPATDHGLLRGDGAFEVIRVYEGRTFALEEHLKRLDRSASELRLAIDLEAVRSDARRLLSQAGAGPDHELLRIVVTRGGSRLLLTEPLPETPERVRLGTITYVPTRVLDGVKSLSYAGNMLASRLAREQGFDEALLVSPHGRVLEAPTSSIFWIEDGNMMTPPLSDHILASITRGVVIDQCGAIERACTLEDLASADEAFLASTVREVQPIAAIDERSFAAVGPITERTAREVASRIQSTLDGH